MHIYAYAYAYVYICIHMNTYMQTLIWVQGRMTLMDSQFWYGVDTISRLLKIMGLFCRISCLS